MLRTRIAEGAERAAARALPVLVLGVLISAAAALVGPRLVALGLIAYLAGATILLVPAVRAARTRPPTSFPAWSILAGFSWFMASLVVLVLGGTVFLVTVLTYGFATAAMLIPAVAEFDVATGRTVTREE